MRTVGMARARVKIGGHDYSLSFSIYPFPNPSSGFLAFVTSIPSDTIPIMRTSL